MVGEAMTVVTMVVAAKEMVDFQHKNIK